MTKNNNELVDANGFITIKPDSFHKLDVNRLMNWIIWGNKEGSWRAPQENNADTF